MDVNVEIKLAELREDNFETDTSHEDSRYVWDTFRIEPIELPINSPFDGQNSPFDGQLVADHIFPNG